MFEMIFKYFQVFLQVFQTHISSVSSYFFCMLQLLHVDVSKVYHVGSGRGVSGPCAGDVRAAQAPAWARETQARTGACWREGRPRMQARRRNGVQRERSSGSEQFPDQ